MGASQVYLVVRSAAGMCFCGDLGVLTDSTGLQRFKVQDVR
jgi:hypothetical protein